MTISVIVPVYNAKKTIKRAVESVKKQSFLDWELILVDDGSTDESLSCICKMAKTETRIRILSQKNAGPGKARQKGIEAAAGEYLFFLDADDYLPEDALKNLVEVIKEYPYDIVKGLYYNCREEKKDFVKYPWTEGEVNRKGTTQQVKRYHLVKTSSAFGYLWGTLYKKTFLEKNSLVLDKINLSFMEDTIFNLEAVVWEPQYYLLCKPVYNYVIGTGTLSSNVTQDFFIKVYEVVKEYSLYLEEKGKYKQNTDLLIPLAARCFCWAVISTVTHHNVTYTFLKEKIKAFAKTSEVQKILREESMISDLFLIASKAESLMYSVCFLLLKWKAYGLLALMFLVLKMPMNLYVNKVLK